MDCFRRGAWRLLASAVLTAAGVTAAAAEQPGLLFHLSGAQGTTADHAASGTAAPTFDSETAVIQDGAIGAAIQCGDLQRLAWAAPGNIYAQRGTLSFYWRARYPVGPTEFPLFRVAYGDHSSWDMTWLRIDYNGHGIDAFVTDASLARTRVSATVKPFARPDQWTLITFSWDEQRGVALYLDGKLAAQQTLKRPTRYDALLDQFGPHSRIISPYQVQSDYNFTRGGDIDEIRIYDRALSAAQVAQLAARRPLQLAQPAPSSAPKAWGHRYGWDRELPPHYPGRSLAVRKVEIHDARDLQRWWWKASDGIRETTWPGVYNRSRLPGRNDYFQLPDWDAYVESGKAIRFSLPDEAVNHVEISGAAHGRLERLEQGAARLLATRAPGREITVHRFAQPIKGGQLRFTNTLVEEPIGELAAYHVTAGTAPAGSRSLAFRLGGGAPADPTVAALEQFIRGRFPAAERSMLVARAEGEQATAAAPVAGLPLVHVLVPNRWDALAATDGLDGIAIELPALPASANGALVPLNIRVKDPLWPMRDMLDFSFSVRAGEATTLWLDLRDRVLPAGRGIWLSIASSAPGFQAELLREAALRLVFKPRAQTLAEHALDRFTQARDSYAMLVEEHPRSPKFALWRRFEGDLQDLLRVDPAHALGLSYAAASGIQAAPVPLAPLPAPPPGVPLWAQRQSELLERVSRFVDYYIDKRQSAYGDFGGGISDDTDLLNLWPGLALMGAQPDKIRRSTSALLEASYRNGMWAKGLSAIQTDELHSYEEGINTLGQVMVLEHGSPRQLERAMATARGVHAITGINRAGHRHLRTSYFSGTRMALEAPWNTARPFGYLVLQPGQLLVDYNGSPAARRSMLELADGLLAHPVPKDDNGVRLARAIRFDDDADVPATRNWFPWHVYWGAYKWTGEGRYLQPIVDAGAGTLKVFAPNPLDALQLRGDGMRKLLAAPVPAEAKGVLAHLEWQQGGDKSKLAALYETQIAQADRFEFINTEGSLWTDRVDTPAAELQRARLGGLALLRYAPYPGHAVSWRFAAPASARSVAILIPDASPKQFKVIAYNLESEAVNASMTGWNIDPGIWEVTQGIDSDDDDVADRALATRSLPFERSRSIALTLPPRAATVLTLTLKHPGTPYWSRQDLGIDPQDVTRRGQRLTVKVHSLGGIASRSGEARLVASDGAVLARVPVPAIAAPDDLQPKTATVALTVPQGVSLTAARIELAPGAEEITALNDVVGLSHLK